MGKLYVLTEVWAQFIDWNFTIRLVWSYSTLSHGGAASVVPTPP